MDRIRDEGVTVVHATHAPEEALAADHCVVMRGGRVTASGPPEEAVGDWGVMRR